MPSAHRAHSADTRTGRRADDRVGRTAGHGGARATRDEAPRTGRTPRVRSTSPRSPFVFDLRELGRSAGTSRDYQRTVPAPEGLGIDVIGVPPGAPVELDLRLESVTEGVLVTGGVVVELVGECARCLQDLTLPLRLQVCELFAYAASTTERTTSADEVFRIEDDLLDVQPVVRDAIVLALPWTPLCRADCPGLCPTCGRHLDDLPADHRHVQLDPRWAALAALRGSGADGTDGPDG